MLACVCTQNTIAQENAYTYLLSTDPVTRYGESPLAVAVHKRNLDVIKYLVKECNANVNGESSV